MDSRVPDNSPDPDYGILGFHGLSDQLPDPPPEPRTQFLPTILAAVLIVAVGAAGFYFYRGRSATPSPDAAGTTQPAPEAATAPLGGQADVIDVPPLDESDDAVRKLLSALTSNPTVAAWLATDNLIRNFTVVVANIASGDAPARHVQALRPREPFTVTDRGEDIQVNARSYARYTTLAKASASIEPAGAARLYSTLKPRIEEAYRELGEPGTTFDQTLERAIVRLLHTPVPEGQVSLQPNGAVTYRFADRSLEKLDPAQKLLIRFGPDNQREVQASLRAIALALGIPEDRLN
jgi:hypothetical protein